MSDRHSTAITSRVIMVVWDGMRPDLATPDLTPNLLRLADQGAWFDASHAQCPTVTRVNAATIATGALPETHGLPANLVYAPLVDPHAPISFGEGESFAQLRRAYDVFRTQTIADVVGTNGGRVAVVSNGTRGSALMCHPNVRERGDLLLHPTLSAPGELGPFVERLGPLPDASIPDSARHRWFARAVTDIVLPELRPELLVFWQSDPDKSQHRFGLGHPQAARSIRDADANLGLILEALDRVGLRRETAIVVVSDHGYTTVSGQVDLAAELVRAGLKASLDSRDVVVAANGTATLLYLPSDEGELAERVGHFLHGWEGTEVILSGGRGRRVLDGTFSLETIGVGGPLAPDLLVGLRWSDAVNEHGHAGSSAENGRTNLAGHGGLSSWDIRNTLVMAGPGLRQGLRSALPVGNWDIAPTLLCLLGLPIPPTVQGRVLAEALSGAGGEQPRMHAEVESHEHRGVRTELRWSSFAGRRYLDSGRRTTAPASAPAGTTTTGTTRRHGC